MKKIISIALIIILVLPVLTTYSNAQETEKKWDQYLYLSQSKDINGVIDIYSGFSSKFEVNLISQIKIFKGKCESESKEYVGIIDGKDIKLATSAAGFITKWDIDLPLKNLKRVQDGEYCMGLISYNNSQNEIALGTFLDITINTKENRKPVILNNFKEKFLSTNTAFRIDIDGKDLDGETLEYNLVGTYDYLSIDKSTGVINSTQNVTKLGGNLVNINIKDKATSASTAFYLNFLDNINNFEDIALSIESPSSNAFFTADKNKIAWKLKNPTKVKEVLISISSNDIEWTNIQRLAPTTSEYTYDTKGVKDGIYRLRFLVFDLNGNAFGYLSDPFLISNSKSSTIEVPYLYDLTPGSNSKVTVSTQVTGRYILPESTTIKSSVVKINDIDSSSSCSFNTGKFTCSNVVTKTGDYLTQACITIDKGVINCAEWSFEATSDAGPVIPNNSSINSLITVAALICLLLLIILIPWLLFTRFLNNRKKTTTTQTTVQNTTTTTSTTTNFNDEYYKLYGMAQPQENKNEIKTTSSDVSPFTTTEPTPALMPSSYTEEEIPDWLKDPNTNASDPIGAAGQKYESPKPLEGTKPFGMTDYGTDEDEA